MKLQRNEDKLHFKLELEKKKSRVAIMWRQLLEL